MVHQLFRLQESLQFSEEEILYNNLIKFWVHMKLVRLTKMCLNETYSNVHIHKHLIIFLPNMI
jgi:hypothetical protein